MCDAIKLAGYSITQVDKLKDIPKGSNIVTIRDKDSSYAYILQHPAKLITWFQGISPEEMNMIYQGKFDRIPRFIIHRLFERFALCKGALNIFVSDAMKQHFQRHYGHLGTNQMIMPCFGNSIDANAFTDERYTQPRFLYSGSAVAWQCVDKMLLLFKKIQAHIPNATLNILTNEQKEMKEILQRMKMDIPLDFVEPDKLQQHIRQFKYGFIVRDDIDVNRVATPTKMSNYMGAGIIPVYSDVILDYKDAISKKNPMVIPFNSDDECISKIIETESKNISGKDLFEHYAKTFNEYWNRDKYVNEMATKIKEL